MNLKLLKVVRFFHLINKKNYNEKRQIEIVKDSPLFDAKWYLAQNQDVKAQKIGAAKHYVKYGWKEGRNPSPDFDGNAYLNTYPDIRNVCPLVHYILNGRDEKRYIRNLKGQPIDYNQFVIAKKINEISDYDYIRKSKFFNKKWYLKNYPSVQGDPIEYYLNYGWEKGHNPSKYFNTNEYLELNSDIKQAHINPLLHYIKYGKREGRIISFKQKKAYLEKVYKSKYFSAKFYMQMYPEVQNTGLDAYEHYLKIGWKEGKNPSKYFNTKKYLYTYPDILKAGINPLVHYINFGKKEGRKIYKATITKNRLKVPTSYQPMISVIVASYNYENLIKETLNSLLNQTYKNFEIIVVDDGSSDNSVKVIKKYTSKYPNVFLYRHKRGMNRGLAETVKLGISKAKGEYIAFCESDDYWENNCLETRVKMINNYKNVSIISNNLTMFGDIDSISRREAYLEKVTEYLDEGENQIDLNFDPYMNFIPTFSSVMIKKDILDKLDYNSPIPAWLDFWLYRQILVKYPLYYCPEKLTNWRMHQSFNDVSKSQKYAEDNMWFVAKSNALLKNKVNVPYFDIIRKSRYFDKKYYTKKYQEYLEGLDPVTHYICKGWKQGFNPSKKFSNDIYLSSYIDIYKSNMNPLVHYELYGKSEKREIFSVYEGKNSIIKDLDIEEIKKEKQYSKVVLLISHELSLTGAPRALLNMAISMKKQGVYPVILSWTHGPMETEIIENGIKLVIDVSLYTKLIQKNEQISDFLSLFDIVIFNTLVSLHLVDCFPKVTAKKICWIHEGRMSYETLKNIINFRETFKFFDEIYSVGQYSKSFTDQYIDNIHKSKILLYGIPDIPHKHEISNNTKIKFILPGAISERKGQAILLSALEYIPERKHKDIEFILVGPCMDKEIEANIKKAEKIYKNIKYLGAIQHNKLLNLYQDMDIVLCPSIDDPMPIVCTEAMIFAKTIIITECTGTASFIENGINGYKIPAGDAAALARAIISIVDNKDKISVMGQNLRSIYDNKFSQDIFDKEIYKVIKE